MRVRSFGAAVTVMLAVAACSGSVSSTTMRCRLDVGPQTKTVPIKMVGTTPVTAAFATDSFKFWMDNSDLHVDVRDPSGNFSSVGGLSATHATPGGNVGFACRQ